MGTFIKASEYIGKRFEISGLDHTSNVSFTIMDARSMTISGIFDPVLFHSSYHYAQDESVIEDENGEYIRVEGRPEPYMKDFEIIEVSDGENWYPYHKNASYNRVS